MAALTLGLAACTTSAPTAHWEGGEPLSDATVSVPGYEAAPGLPHLTAPKAARAAGLSQPTAATATHARGDGWSVSVEQGAFGTRVVLGRACGTPQADADAATAAATALYERLGGDPAQQAWFAVEKQGTDRVFAEPLLAGTQTWSTGFLAIRTDRDGVCALSGTAMAFRETGKPSPFTSPEDAFAVVAEGRFTAVEQTYTLSSGGRLAPVWRFSGDAGSAVVVDLGDGLESAPDTETYLRTVAAPSQ